MSRPNDDIVESVVAGDGGPLSMLEPLAPK